jgi:chromosomal replication initiator protein
VRRPAETGLAERPEEDDEVQGRADDSVREDLDAVWRRVLLQLRASVPEPTYRLWFEPLRPAGCRGNTLFLTGPEQSRRWVARRYPELLRAALQRAGSGLGEVEFVSVGSEAASRSSPAESAARSRLNPDYSFERFVIGPGNRLAHASALAVAEAPGESYNPLFLHGPPGLGKTHLLGAISSYLHEHSPGLDVHYTTAESFTNEFVACLKASGAEGFKQRYRRADVLLIDDVQFLEGKLRTSDEFFHTFNALYENGAQIVLTADRMPSELTELAERLRQRFEWGLAAELEPPDLSTRLLFLANAVRDRGVTSVGPDGIRAIASRAASNLRLLDGALTRVLALASLSSTPVSPEAVDRALPAEIGAEKPTLHVEQIQSVVASRLGVSLEQLLSPSRVADVARARQLAMYLCRELTDLSLPAIARAFNRRDHTTVIHAIRRVEERTTEDPGLARQLESLSVSLRQEEIDRDRTD